MRGGRGRLPPVQARSRKIQNGALKQRIR